MGTLRTFAIQATYGLALAIGATTLLPSAAFAASDVYGLAISPSVNAFGQIDVSAGTFTQIGGDTGLGTSSGYFAPVFDPAVNAFFVSQQPIGNAFGNQFEEINATTGAVTTLCLDMCVTGSPHVAGLGFDPLTGQLFAITHEGSFGSVDLTTGNFIPIGSSSILPTGDFAPVFDPQTNSFLITLLPISGSLFTSGFAQMYPATGVITFTNFPVFPPDFLFVEGLGVASSPAAGVPEASTWTMMVVGFAALGYAAFRRTGKSFSPGHPT
jgi:hypothetical protein